MGSDTAMNELMRAHRSRHDASKQGRRPFSIKAALASTAIMRAAVAGLTLTGTFVAADLAITPAFADGGQGGAPAFGGSGGSGGTAAAPTGGHGSDEDLITVFGGGGGGGGGVSLATGAGGAGGTGGTVQPGSGDSAGGDGGSGGNFGLVISSAPNGVAISGTVGGTGGNSAVGGGGGGGGGGEGGGGVLFTGLAASSNASTIAGGNGGDGGNSGNSLFTSGSGGSGGSGGVGVALTGGANFTNNAGATVQGGDGGGGAAAGYSVNDVAGNGGNGGNGGTGVLMVNGGTLTNAGTITGGAAGAAGLGGTGLVNGANGVSGVGGAGVVGSNITVVNSGTIAGGLSSDGITRANAITFTGGTNTLQFGGATSGLIGNISVTGALTINQFAPVTVSNAITGSGSLTIAGNSFVTLSGTNTYAGGTTISGGLAISSAANIGTGNLTFNAPGTLRTSGTIDLTGRTITLNAGSAGFEVVGAADVLSASGITGVGSLSKSGAGTLTLSGTNNYSDATLILAGTLKGGAANAFSAASATYVGSSGTLDLGGFSQTINTVNVVGGSLKNGSLTGTVNASGGNVSNIAGSALVNANGGTTTLTGSNSYTGATTINGGTLRAGSAGAFSATSAMTINGGTVDLGGYAQTINTVALVFGGVVPAALRNGSLTGTVTSTGGGIGGLSGSMSLVANGHTTTVTGPNTYTGATTVNNGALLFTPGDNWFSAASAVTINSGGTFLLSGSRQTINAVALAGGSLAEGILTGAVTSTGGTLINMFGSMSLTANGGTTTVGGFSSGYTGATTVNNGATLLGGVVNGFSPDSATTINSGGTVNLGGFAQTINSVTLAGGTLAFGTLTGAVISIDGDLVDVGGGMSLTTNSGTTTVSGTNTYTGATTVNNGATLTGSGVNAFSAASATTIGIGGVVNLNGFLQTINTVALAGGRLSNGFLAGAVTSTGGTIASIGGGMNLTANGGTTMFLFGNTYTGATTVNNGATLFSVVDNSFSAASAMTINSGGTVNFGGTAQTINAVALAGGTLESGLLNGAVTSTGGTLDSLRGGMSLTANGGATTVAGTNTYTGLTTVNGGLLSVNGSIVSDVTVNAGGTLGGNGTVGNTTVNGGALAPGNSIGLLTVQGSLIFTAAASYMVQVSPVSADRTNVTGAATLGGATVNASFAPGTYIAKQYTIVNAGSGVHGKFSSLVNTDLPSGFTASLSYGTDDAYLNLALSFVPPPGTGLNANQQNVGNAIVNFFNSTGGIPIVFGALTPAGLTQLSGEAGTGSQQTTFNAMNQFIGVMTDPLVAGRGDGVSAGGTAAGYADEEALAYAQKRKPSDALAAIYTKAPPRAPTFEQRWSVWAAAFGGSQTTNGNTVVGSNDTRSSIYGTAVGADYRFSPNTIVGFAIAGGGTNFSVANNLGGGRSDLFQAGAFIRHDVGPVYLTGALAYGWQDITTDRTVTVAGVDRLRAELEANAWSGRLEGGYRFVAQGFGLTPYAAGQFTTFDLPNYAETAIVGTNMFALAYNSKSVTDTRSELGLRTDRSFVVPDGVLTLRGRAAWAHDFNPDRSIGATFQTLPGASFVVNGAAQAHDSALTSASAEMKFISGISLAATFEGEFSDVTRSYAGKGVVRYAW
jgi:autotransporter-associated beta strand protein